MILNTRASYIVRQISVLAFCSSPSSFAENLKFLKSSSLFHIYILTSIQANQNMTAMNSQQREVIPTIVFSTDQLVLRPTLARDLSYGTEDELNQKLNDMYWFQSGVEESSSSSSSSDEESDDEDQIQSTWLSQASPQEEKEEKPKSCLRSRAFSEELEHQMKIRAIPKPQDAEDDKPKQQKFTSLRNQLSKRNKSKNKLLKFLRPSRRRSVVAQDEESSRSNNNKENRHVRFTR